MKCKSFIAQFKISKNRISSFKYFSKCYLTEMSNAHAQCETAAVKNQQKYSYKVIFQTEKN